VTEPGAAAPPQEVDVLVAGAGPAGAVAAADLARRGFSVLLADDAGGVGDHDVLVSAQARQALAALGLPEGALLRPAATIRLSFGAAAGRSIASGGAAVCSRARLGEALRRLAVAAGATAVRGRVTSVARAAGGFEALVAGRGPGGETRRVAARHVVAATGSAARGAAALGTAALGTAALGTAALGTGAPGTGLACAQRFAAPGLHGQLLLAMTAPAADGPGAPPTCVWALPGADGTVTVAASRVGGPGSAAPESLLAAALETLAGADARFAAVTPAGPVVSGPLDAGFTPGRVTDAGHLLVGDAAGLVNPFTGEGLSYAVQSALLAARSVAEEPADPGAAGQAYARQLSAGFVGYFETARHVARRYHLTWRVLAATAGSDHPFFAKARRAILLPEGLNGLATTERVDLTRPEAVLLAPFLAACDEVSITTIRRQWPFLARLILEGEVLGGPRLRPAVLLFAALLAGGRRPEPARATLGAGIELAQLGALSFLGPPPGPAPPARGVDWAAATTVLAGDFLLAQASRLVAESAPEVSWSFSDWLAELTALRVRRLDPAGPDVPAGAVFAALLEFPARIGAMLGGASPETVQAVRDVGHHCGHAFLHAEDVLALRGERTRLDTTLQAMLHGGVSAIPEHGHDRPVDARRLAAEPGLRSAALAASAEACRAARDRALEATAAVPSPAAARILREFVTAVARPACGMPSAPVRDTPSARSAIPSVP